MPHLVILPAARADLLEIGDFIALDNPSRATSFLKEIEAKMKAAAERPGSFPNRDELHEGLRSARHGHYLIFFFELTRCRSCVCCMVPAIYQDCSKVSLAPMRM